MEKIFPELYNFILENGKKLSNRVYNSDLSKLKFVFGNAWNKENIFTEMGTDKFFDTYDEERQVLIDFRIKKLKEFKEQLINGNN